MLDEPIIFVLAIYWNIETYIICFEDNVYLVGAQHHNKHNNLIPLFHSFLSSFNISHLPQPRALFENTTMRYFSDCNCVVVMAKTRYPVIYSLTLWPQSTSPTIYLSLVSQILCRLVLSWMEGSAPMHTLLVTFPTIHVLLRVLFIGIGIVFYSSYQKM